MNCSSFTNFFLHSCELSDILHGALSGRMSHWTSQVCCFVLRIAHVLQVLMFCIRKKTLYVFTTLPGIQVHNLKELRSNYYHVFSVLPLSAAGSLWLSFIRLLLHITTLLLVVTTVHAAWTSRQIHLLRTMFLSMPLEHPCGSWSLQKWMVDMTMCCKDRMSIWPSCSSWIAVINCNDYPVTSSTPNSGCR